jgi:hypothetical protein
MRGLDISFLTLSGSVDILPVRESEEGFIAQTPSDGKPYIDCAPFLRQGGQNDGG